MGEKKEKREELSGRNYDASLNRNTKKESQKTILPVFFFSLFLPTGHFNSRWIKRDLKKKKEKTQKEAIPFKGLSLVYKGRE